MPIASATSTHWTAQPERQRRRPGDVPRWDGPEHCSGLPVERYDAAGLSALLGNRWDLVTDSREDHTTPGGARQPFTWTAFRRR